LRGSGAVQPTKDASGQANPTDAVVACNPTVGKTVAAPFDVGNEDAPAAFITAVGKFVVLPAPAPAPDVGNALWTDGMPPAVAGVLTKDEVPAEDPAEDPAKDPAAVPAKDPAAVPAKDPAAVPDEVPDVEPAEVPAKVPDAEPAEDPAEDPAKVGKELAEIAEPMPLGNGVGLAPSPAPPDGDGGLTSPPPDGGLLP